VKKREDARLVATVISGSWRQSAQPLEISDSELAEIAALLIQAGAGALVWWRIRDTALASSDAAAQMHQAYRLHRLQASLHVRRIKRVLRQFRAAGIEPVLVKGWNVARLYPEPGLRHYFDVDLCVAHDRYAEANGLVESWKEDSPYVDLHDELDHLDVMRWDDFVARSQVLKLDDTEVRVPCAEDHLRILCIHWLRHGAWKPAGLCDIGAELESRPSDFDWQRCLGPDPVRAGWVACTIGLARELLGAGDEAKGEEQRAKCDRHRADGDRSTAGYSAPGPLPLDLSSELPRWLVPAVLRQWSRSLSPMYREPALPAFLDRLNRWKELTMDLYSRLDQPVRATVAMRGRFNNWPRLPYQLGELLLHSAEAPKQLGMMVRQFVAQKAFGHSAQSTSLEKRVPKTIPDGI
jgi:hypothetical protein